MRIINQNIMNQLFATTDEIPLDREAVQVPLAMEGEGRVARTAKGKIEITLPDVEDHCAVLAVGSANGIGKFVHRNHSLNHRSVRTLTPPLSRIHKKVKLSGKPTYGWK